MPQTRKLIPDNAPFSPQEAEWLNHFFTQLSPEQANWLSGFISGYQAHQLTGTRSITQVLSEPEILQSSLPPGATFHAAQPPSKPSLTILYGTESGNAEGLAAEAKKRASKLGFKARMVDMADITPLELPTEENLIVIISTWGEGEPPDRAASYHRNITATDMPRLDGVRYAVLGLGDSGYEQFCQMGKEFDARLEQLGATRFKARIDCDTDYEGPAHSWLDSALSELQTLTTHRASPSGAQNFSGSAHQATSAAPIDVILPIYGKKNPYPAALLDRVVLNGSGSSKETLHIELSLEDSGMTYQPGDSLAVLPVNCPEVVSDIIRASGLSPEIPVMTKTGDAKDLYNYILEECDATILSKVLIQKYHELMPNEALESLLLPENRTLLQEFIWGREILDLLIEFPIPNLSAENLINLLRRLPPRLYSIASSLKAYPEQVHLTVAAVRYHTHRRNRKGVCSTFLADRIGIGEKIPVYVVPNKHFKLPADSATPIIMVGPGTGVAPFRSFLQERQATGASGNNWLFFGDRNFTTDFLYQLEWQDFHKDGLLTRMDVAFSRDTPEKRYVQHCMLEKSRDLYAWLEEGAHFYVCGDATDMAVDVHQTLNTILQKEGDRSAEQAEAYLEQLKKSNRYQRDVY